MENPPKKFFRLFARQGGAAALRLFHHLPRGGEGRGRRGGRAALHLRSRRRAAAIAARRAQGARRRCTGSRPRDAVPAEVRLYNPLFTTPDPDASELCGDLNPNSLRGAEDARLEPALAGGEAAEPGAVRAARLFLPRPRFAARAARCSTAPSACATAAKAADRRSTPASLPNRGGELRCRPEGPPYDSAVDEGQCASCHPRLASRDHPPGAQRGGGSATAVPPPPTLARGKNVRVNLGRGGGRSAVGAVYFSIGDAIAGLGTLPAHPAISEADLCLPAARARHRAALLYAFPGPRLLLRHHRGAGHAFCPGCRSRSACRCSGRSWGPALRDLLQRAGLGLDFPARSADTPLRAMCAPAPICWRAPGKKTGSSWPATSSPISGSSSASPT